MRRMEIEALLAWAYRDELPKAEMVQNFMRPPEFRAESFASVGKMGEYMTVLDEPDLRNKYGMFPDRFAQCEPHPDAVLVHEAVEQLAGCTFAVPEGWDPLSDMGDLGADGLVAVARGIGMLTTTTREGAVVLRRSPARLVIRHAILGGCPEWAGDVPERRVVTGPGGKPAWFRTLEMVEEGAFGVLTSAVEVDGYDYRSRRPFADAYRKFVLDPDPAPVVEARAEYEIWRAALDLLVEDLAGALSGREVEPSPRARRPWEASDAQRRILPSLLALPANHGPSRVMTKKKSATA